VDNAADVPGFIAGASGDGWRIERDFGAFPVTLSGETGDGGAVEHAPYRFPDAIEAWRFTNFVQTSTSRPRRTTPIPTATVCERIGIRPRHGSEHGIAIRPAGPRAGCRRVSHAHLLASGGCDGLDVSRGSLGRSHNWDTGSTYSATGDVLSNEFTTQLSRTTVNGVETIVVRDNQTTNAGRRFMRLKVTNP